MKYEQEYRSYIQQNKENTGPTCIDLFAGCGGFSLGFIKAGYRVIWANECAKEAADTYEYNLGKHVDRRRIEKIPSSEIPDASIIIGGPPCQGFSLMGKRMLEDPRSKLVNQFVRVVRDKQPKAFILENVPGLCSMGGYESNADRKRHTGKLLKELLIAFHDCGYNVSWGILDAAFYGVPQYRRRLFIIGKRNVDMQAYQSLAGAVSELFGVSLGEGITQRELEPMCLQDARIDKIH